MRRSSVPRMSSRSSGAMSYPKVLRYDTRLVQMVGGEFPHSPNDPATLFAGLAGTGFALFVFAPRSLDQRGDQNPDHPGQYRSQRIRQDHAGVLLSLLSATTMNAAPATTTAPR